MDGNESMHDGIGEGKGHQPRFVQDPWIPWQYCQLQRPSEFLPEQGTREPQGEPHRAMLHLHVVGNQNGDAGGGGQSSATFYFSLSG